MSSAHDRRVCDELSEYLAEVKDKLESVTRSVRKFELTPQEQLELTYICQRIEYYLKVYAGQREPRRHI